MRIGLLAGCVALAFAGEAAAQSYNLIAASADRTVLADRSSIRRDADNIFITSLRVQPTPERVNNDWYQFVELDHEFDCAGNFRILDTRFFAVDGRYITHVAGPNVWKDFEAATAAAGIEALVCRDDPSEAEAIQANRAQIVEGAIRLMTEGAP